MTFSGDTASVVCKKDELDDAYASMQMQLDARGEQVTGAYYEIYYDDRTVEIKAPLYRASQIDMTELPAFVQDEDAVGKWKFCDIVPSQEQFLYGHRKCNYSTHFDEIYFLEGGEGYWIFGGWTRGYCCTDVSNHGIGRYMIKETDGHKLMFLEMVHGDKRTAPEIWVYEKISDAHLHASDIRRQDFVDYPFVTDEQVLGNWRVKDFYGDEDRAFDPSIQNFPIQELFLLRVSFLPSGVCIHVTKNHEDMLRWTKGYLLNIPQKLASAYEIRVVNGTEYLILEWKSGDYVYGPDASVYHYVFERE